MFLVVSFLFHSWREAPDIFLLGVSLCRQFSVLSERRSHSRPNKLDRCRREYIKKNLVNIFSGFLSIIPLCHWQTFPSLSHSCQILLARQAVRVRRRVTRRTVKQRLFESRKFLKTLQHLAIEVRQAQVPISFIGTKMKVLLTP